MQNILKVLDERAKTLEVVLLERQGRRLRLQSPLPLAAGTCAQLSLEGELLLCEVTASTEQSGSFEVGMRAQEVLRDSWDPHGAWTALRSGESVMRSLVALHTHLASYEKRR
jgi:hypothetical protein